MGQSSTPETNAKPRSARCRFRAQLFGGEGDGLIIELASLDQTIAVYRNGGAPFAATTDAQPAPAAGARLLGTYELVGPVGPDTPVYIPAR